MWRRFTNFHGATFLGSVFGRPDFSRNFIFGPPDFCADFVAGFYFSHFCGKKCPEESSRKILGKILQNVHNKNPRHISAEGLGELSLEIQGWNSASTFTKISSRFSPVSTNNLCKGLCVVLRGMMLVRSRAAKVPRHIGIIKLSTCLTKQASHIWQEPTLYAHLNP